MAIESQHDSAWSAALDERPTYPPLAGDADADVLILGGGITGVTAAEALYYAGRRVTLITMNRIAGGTTGYSTGHLDTTLDTPLSTLISRHGEDAVRQVLDAKRNAVDHIETLQQRYGYDADFQRLSAYQFAEPDQDADALGEEFDAARRLGLAAQEAPCDDVPLPCSRAIRFDDQARHDPMRHTVRLAAALADRGVTIHEQTAMDRIVEGDDGQTVTVETARGTITARHVLCAGHASIWGTKSVQPRVYPWQSYVLTVRLADPLPDALFWDMADPYRYWRRAGHGDANLAVVGGFDHRTGDADAATPDRFADLEAYARARLDVAEVVHRWSHEFFETADGLPYVGHVPGMKRTLIATGFSGVGLTLGTLSGRLMADLTVHHDDLPAQGGDYHNPLADALDPARIKPLASAVEAAKGLGYMAGHAVADKLGPADVGDPDALQPGQGAIVSGKGGKLAVYRDDDGNLTRRSATCTHLGCTVQWNAAEKTWDCPCHGGRYDHDGQPIAGPPSQALAPAE